LTAVEANARPAPRPFRIAHISDLHVLELNGTHWSRFLNKRATGAVNLAGLRRNAHPVHVAELLAERLRAEDIDHVILTGDLTNLALESEFARVRQVVERIGPPDYITMIPGNHDMYTRGALRHHRFERYFQDYLVDETDPLRSALTKGRLHYPFVRAPAPHVRIYGLSSAIPTPPLLAFGHVGRAQLDRLRALVAAEPPTVRVRIVLVHHNLHHRVGAAEYVASLIDRKALGEAMHDIHATVVLHGHTHHPHQGHLPGRRAPVVTVRALARADEVERKLDQAAAHQIGADIPVIGCGSSTLSRVGRAAKARFNVLEVHEGHLERVSSFRLDGEQGEFLPEYDDLLHKALGRIIHT
jgi:3',5'-cyclic AMP phosphodiesterase CpdA